MHGRISRSESVISFGKYKLLIVDGYRYVTHEVKC